MSDQDLTFLGRTTFRNEGKLFGIRRADRRHHLYVIGKSGTGKSTLLETMIRQDLVNGEGLAAFDPHGDLIERILRRMPPGRAKDVIYLNPSDPNNGITFNPLADVLPDRQAVTAAGLLEAFKKLWPDFWGPRTEHFLRNALLALLEVQKANLSHVLRMYSDKEFRKQVVSRLTNTHVKQFWTNEYSSYSPAFRAQALAPIRNKIGAFLANPYLAHVLVSASSSFDLREIMDRRRILLVNLGKGQIGEETAQLLGSLLISSIGIAGLSRGDTSESGRPDFYVFVDEFHNFTTLSFASQMAEQRKYRVGLTLANQHLAQLDSPIREAVLGNVSSLICFRVGAGDARTLEKEFTPEIRRDDLSNLPNYEIAIKLLVRGEATRPFSAKALKIDSPRSRIPP